MTAITAAALQTWRMFISLEEMLRPLSLIEVSRETSADTICDTTFDAWNIFHVRVNGAARTRCRQHIGTPA